MSLVDYQSSSDESENENMLTSEKIIPVKEPVKIVGKKKEPVKIIIPTIAEEEEETNPLSLKYNKSKTSSGLLGLLPPPKFCKENRKTSLVPHVLTKKPETTNSKISEKASSIVSKVNSGKSNSSINVAKNEDNEADDLIQGDFFSLLSSEGETKGISLPPPKHSSYLDFPASGSSETTIHDETNTEVHQSEQFSTASHFQNQSEDDNLIHHDANEESVTASFSSDAAPYVESSNIMNEEGFLRLQGKKRGFEQINIIDVNINEQLSDKTEWTKSLTQETSVHSRKRTRQPTSLQKRKHQITYLAFQARERELDLKNQWAQNRLTKRETQAKYGF